MLEFSDKPYRHFPARRNALVAWLMEIYNRHYALPRQMRIASVQLSGCEDLQALRRPSDRLLLLPNHPTHCDPNIYTEALRRIGLTTHVMAAYDVFLRSRRVAWIMQRMGTFSVDREGSDARAMKQAADTLLAGRHALTIFPEGNVYLQNDVVTPFHDGAALLGLRAARTLADKNVRVLAVPIAIKVTHIDDVRSPLNQTLQALADALQTELPAGASPLEAARLIGRTALLRNLQQRGVEQPAADSLTALIQQSAESLIVRLEQKMSLKPRPRDSLVERIRRARRAIHDIRLDESRAQDHAAARNWADEAMLALRIASYSGDYVESRPTIDRIAETIEKLSEDIYGRTCPPTATRSAFVHFCQPIDLDDYRESFARKARLAVRALTAACEQAVQKALDRLNAANPHAGGKLWTQAPAQPSPAARAHD